MASSKTLLLRELKRHAYLPLRDENDPRILHTTTGSYFQKPNGQIVNPNKQHHKSRKVK